MSNWNNLKNSFQRVINSPGFRDLIGSPITKIVGINTGLFVFF